MDDENNTKEFVDTILEDLPKSGYVRQSELLKSLPFSPATLWRMVKRGDFPKQLKLSKRVSVWRIEEVRDYLKRLHMQSSAA